MEPPQIYAERSRPSQSRAPSRSSTSTGASRMASQTTLDLYAGSSPQRNPTARYQTSCSRSSSSPRPSARSASRLSRESSGEVTRQPAQSSFLQEKLERERKAESEKVAQAAAQSRLNVETDSAAGSSRASQKSPFSPTEPEWQRPRSSGGPEGTKKQPLALKEMEQVVSNLLKQNFDLKLEIHHRRERQEKLEARVETLESDKHQMEEVNDKLLEELEKRDKAVEEAVAMIVMLEARVDQLVEERTLAQAEASEPPQDQTREGSTSTPKPRRAGHDKTINRMPSFVSEQQEGTENLRDVYLNALGSILSLSRVPESQVENDNGPASPTLSVLSESSFLSVYGQKQDKTSTAEVVSYDGAHGGTAFEASGAPLSRGQHQTAVGPRSPLQHIERLDHGYKREKQAQSPRETQGARPPGKSPSRQRTKEEKRQALRKVITEAPGGVRLVDHGMPPTPDTISTSTLHRFKHSDDSLSQRRAVSNETSAGALSDAAATVQDLRAVPETANLQASRPRHADELKYRDHMAFLGNGKVPYQRPHSASETTVSRRRGNDWGSDSDDTDARSVESSLDVWMQESAKPDRGTGRVSPDLFGFPTTTSGRTWATDAMFGPNSVRGAARVDFDNDQMHDLFSIQNALFASTAPPAPNRRSSLHARTASSSAGYPLAQPKTQRSPERATQQGRRNSDMAHGRADVTTPVQAQFPPAPAPAPTSEQKRHRYPPVSGQLGARIGLNKIFRRSVSGAPPNFALDAAPPSAPPPVDGGATISDAVGVPSWVSRGPVAEDDFSSATPPPIMRNPRHARTGSLGHEHSNPAGLEPTRPKTPSAVMMMAPSRQQTQSVQPEEPAQANGGGARRKWLSGFGRSSSLKNRAG